MKKEELRPKDLRTGNLVTLSGSLILTVYEIHEDCFYAKDAKGSSFKNTWAELHPIPLSEEVLLKCGFEKIEVEVDDYYDCSYEKQLNNDVFISYADDFSCTLHWNKKESINGFGVIPNWHSINTVHGLQNLCYILTGEELEVSL